MNLLLEVLINNGLVLDAIGIIGLGLLGLAAVKLARKDKSWGGTMMTVGAVALLLARFYYIISPHVIDNNVLAMIGPIGISLTIALPPLLLSMGLAGIVWGLWGHERWMNEETR
ncbi:MAG: hypothetical protein ABI600_15715 [Luteolibacter sp.]